LVHYIRKFQNAEYGTGVSTNKEEEGKKEEDKVATEKDKK